VHGEAPLTRELIQEAGLTLGNLSKWWNVNDEKPIVLEKIPLYSAQLKEQLQKLQTDIPVIDFLDQYFSGDQNAALRDFVCRRVEGYDAGDPAKSSSFTLRDEILDEKSWQQMSLKEGYGALIRFLENECKKNGVEILLQKEVVTLEHGNEGIRIGCVDASVFQSSAAIVTVPLPVLAHIQFTPAIPEKMQAASNIGFGSVIKILIRFKTKWWTGLRERQFEKLFFMFSNESIPTWWTQYPESYTTLTGWVAGPKAERLSTESDEELLKTALVSLSNIFKVGVDELRKELFSFKVNNWIKDPYTRGAYSYTTPTTAVAIEELRKPIENKLFFAGEALHLGYATATVEGALSNGKEVAVKVLSLA
jgi:monoamine oxidase